MYLDSNNDKRELKSITVVYKGEENNNCVNIKNLQNEL